jgi:protein CWC15
MTTAARPTFTPAFGGRNLSDLRTSSTGNGQGGITERYSSKDQKSHGKLKYRHNLQTLPLLQRRTFSQPQSIELGRTEDKTNVKEGEEEGEEESSAGTMRKLRALSKQIQFTEEEIQVRAERDSFLGEDSADKNINNESNLFEQESDIDSSSQEEHEDEEDDTEALLLELSRIKEARAKEEARKREQEIALSNPLMADKLAPFSYKLGGGRGGDGGEGVEESELMAMNYRVKRRWDDDVVFKNQGDIKPKMPSVFINDLVRSEFHKKFMDKYIQ